MTNKAPIEKSNAKQASKRRGAWGHLASASLVLLLAICFGSALAGVQVWLGPQIAANQRQEIYDALPELVLGRDLSVKMAAENQSLSVAPQTLTVEQGGQRRFYTVYEASYQGVRRGWVAKAAGQGYADRIEVLVGLNSSLNTITGLSVLAQKETPGLGNKIASESWRAQFVQRDTRTPLKVVKSGGSAPNPIDGITGATISSVSVVGIVNGAVADLRTRLNKGSNP